MLYPAFISTFNLKDYINLLSNISMKLDLHVDYRTSWGESVYITGSIPALGGGDLKQALKMTTSDAEHWSASVNLHDNQPQFAYSYVIKNENGNIRREWGKAHIFTPSSKPVDRHIYDQWQDQPADKPFYSQAFTDCINSRTRRDRRSMPRGGYLRLNVDAPTISSNQLLAVCGSAKSLGEWNPTKAVKMNDYAFPTWSLNLPVTDLTADTEYKFVIIDKDSGRLIAWEQGVNRRIGFTPDRKAATELSGLRLSNPMSPWRGAGTAIPVFSLRSDKDFGVGDFFDLFEMVDWCTETGQNFLQLLPINDTTMTHTWTDSYPYNANSTFALHPMYLRISELGKLSDVRQSYYDCLASELNMLPEVDYERATKGKLAYAREVFDINGRDTFSTKEFKDFIKRNGTWLRPYAAFCVLRDNFSTPDFNQWGEYAVYSPTLVDRVAVDYADDFDFVIYLQYHLDRQLHAVRDYAHSKGVAIKGDIPIGISRTSVDAWLNPRLFNLDSQAGAPPDDFSVLGQNWGFPTYNWEQMSLDGFAWWRSRLCKMSEYFDAYRIDHVLGFFRIWQIPMDAIHGLLGIFNPALPFTPDELHDNYDFYLDAGRHTRPLISDWFLGEFFGQYTDEARERFLVADGDGNYHLAEGFDTQRAVADYFSTQEKNEKNTHLYNALLGLIDNVLFIEDPIEHGKYHPRIAAQMTYAYRAMNDYQRWCFDRLYNDFFYHRHNDFWRDKALWKLPALVEATDMLSCAEDLGMIPACVPDVMQRLEILSLEIQRMPKDPRVEFGNPQQYPYYSVCTTSTHDMGGIRQWWEENPAATQRYYNHMLGCIGAAPQFAEPWICERILAMHLASPSMLCILPLQDWLSIDGALRRQDPREEQINVPANSRHYWRYRMHLTIEQLRADTKLSDRLRSMISGSGR